MTRIVKRPDIVIPAKTRKLPALTVKFNEAIQVYAKVKGEAGDNMVNSRRMISAALEGYRMGPEKMYRWMEHHRYKWRSNWQQWVDLRQEN